MIKLMDHVITPTIFPDGTSQLWKIPQEVLDECKNYAIVQWEYEGDNEIFQLCQLCDLLRTILPIHAGIQLKVETLPYARQDKSIDNESTFALFTLCDVLLNRFDKVEVLDVHNPNYYLFTDKFPESYVDLTNHLPNGYIDEAIDKFKPDLICFPDAGAAKRGYDIQGLPSFNLDKKRDQATGEIVGLECRLPLNLDGKRVLMVDDLCDRGGTFIKACQLLKELGTDTVGLYTTHGLYTGGTKLLYDSGISFLFNKDGQVTNTHYDLC